MMRVLPATAAQSAPRALCAALLFVTVGSSLGAQVQGDSATKRDSATVLEVQRVKAAYTPRVIGSAAAVSVAPDSLPLSLSAPTGGELLRRLPFLYVRQNSRGENELSVRGSESRQAAVFFEGVPLTLTWDARADVSAVPTAGVQRLDYVRGLSSLLAGPNAIGGVISMSLWEEHDPSRAPTRVTRAELQADEFGGARSSTTIGGALQHSTASSVQYRVGAGWRDLPGLARPHGVNEPTGNDELRFNTDARAFDAFAGLRYENEKGRYLSGFATHSEGERGVAPELHITNPRRWRNPDVRRSIAGISAGTGALTNRFGVGDAEISLGVNDGLVDINSYNSTYTTVSGTELGEDRTATLRLTFDQQFGQRVVLRGAFTDSRVRYLETINSDPTSTYRQRLSSAATELDVRAARNLTFTGGVSRDASETTEAGGRVPLGLKSGLGWRTGATWVQPTLGLRLHASASERKRFPALRELYSGALNRFEPNPALRPETAHSAEFGVALIRARFDFQTVVFQQRIEDAVVRITLPSTQFQRVNRDEFNSTGVEFTAGTMLGRASLRGDVTFQRARLKDATITNPAERRPEDVPEMFGSLMTIVPIMRGLDTQARVRVVGATRCTNPNTSTLDTQEGAQVLDVGVERRWSGTRMWSRVTAALQLENVSDASLYDKCGLPQAGRTARLTLRFG